MDNLKLLPKDKERKILPEFPQNDEVGPEIPCEEDSGFDQSFKAITRITFGGEQFIESKVHGLSRLRRGKTRIDAVAVDGQQRLNAILRWFDNFKDKFRNAHEEHPVTPVIFLLLSPDPGFSKGRKHAAKGTKTFAREIFTDLNKSAKTVDKNDMVSQQDQERIAKQRLSAMIQLVLAPPGNLPALQVGAVGTIEEQI